jgi:hypothetical protein
VLGKLGGTAMCQRKKGSKGGEGGGIKERGREAAKKV